MFSAKEIETVIGRTNSNTFGIYVGYQEIDGYTGPTKIGRTINVKAIQRGRAQGGANWWFHCFWCLPDRDSTFKLEKMVKKSLKDFTYKGKQNQQELYTLSPTDAYNKLKEILGPASVI